MGIANELTSRNKAGTCHKITNCHVRQLRLFTGMDISVKDLQEAISIRQQIDNLQQRLSSLLRGAPQRPAGPHARGRYFSAATRAKLAAAAKARWARTRGTGGAAPAKRKGQLTPAGRRKLSQLMKARWAARRKAGGTQRLMRRGKKGGLTPAGRRRLSELMKARWAARRKAGGR